MTQVANALPALTPEQKADMESRKGAWLRLAEERYSLSLAMEKQVAELRAGMVLPTAVEHIAAAEVSLVELKKGRAAVEGMRKVFTEKLDKLRTKMMEPEKEVDVMVAQMSQALLPLKQEHERRERLLREKQQEVQQLVGLIKSAVINIDLNYRQKIERTIGQEYQLALNSDLAPDSPELAKHLEAAEKKLGAADFLPERPPFHHRHVTQEELDALLVEHWRENPHAYTEMYRRDLRAKFADYAVAFKNKADALAIAAEQAAERERQLKDEYERQQLAARMEASATTLQAPTVGAPRKALRYNYELEMEENEVNAAKIVAQYWVNIHLTRHKTRAGWFKLTVAQMGKALADVKNDDPAFQPEGINFKETPRL